MSHIAEILRLGAGELAGHIRRREISPVEAVQASLDAIGWLDPTLHAFCTLDAEGALESARALEVRLARGEDCGPLAGVPVGVKDLVLTKGLRTTFGSPLYADFIPEEDDVAVARLRAAGAIILGKTNAAELGYGGVGHNPLFPTTTNPWDVTRTPGGSSAGSAAAVAARLCPLAIGSDGGGSVRLPAAFTGLVGIKASMGRVPLWPGCRDERFPGVSGWESIEHIGSMARSVADAALMLSVMAGPDPRDRLSLPGGVDWRGAARPREKLNLRVAWCPDWGGVAVDPEIRALTAAAALAFAEDLGCTVEEIADPIGDVIDVYRGIVALETDIVGMRRLARGREASLSLSVQGLLTRRWEAETFQDAITARKTIQRKIAGLMARYDLLLTPTVPLFPFPIDRDGPGTIDGQPVAGDSWTPACFPFNLTGQPAASVPAGLGRAGLPAGLQIVGRHLADETVIAAATAFEAIRPFELKPKVST